jgi:hypothetical protein
MTITNKIARLMSIIKRAIGFKLNQTGPLITILT